MLFAILFGLSMDYNVFLLSRIHEAYNEGDRPRESVIHGMPRIGKVVLFAGLIMSAVFLAFVTQPDVIGKMMGLGLGLAILIDVLFVRLLVAPAVVTLLGDKAWWLPGWLDKILPERLARGAPRRGARYAQAGAGAGAGLSDRAAGREPDAVEAEVGLLGQNVVVAVVVQDAEAVAVGDGGDEEIDRRQPVVADARELALRVERALLDVVVDAESGGGRRDRSRSSPCSRASRAE